MKNIKRILHNAFLALGFGTVVYVPMLLIDKGLNDTMQSVLTWVFASVLYGISFEALRVKGKYRFPVHITICFIITIATRIFYSLIKNGMVDLVKTILITIPIFVAVYILLYLFMRFVGDAVAEAVS